jgi:hypothetical protein
MAGTSWSLSRSGDHRIPPGGKIMEVLYPKCCGIDVHKQFLVACLLIVGEAGQQHQEIRRFSTMTGELLSCVDWLQKAHCTAVAMESTGVYWKPVWNVMEGLFETVMIVNAEHMRRVAFPQNRQERCGMARRTLAGGFTQAQLHSLPASTGATRPDPHPYHSYPGAYSAD